MTCRFTSFYKDKKSRKSHKPAEIKVFLTIFASRYGSVLPANRSGSVSGNPKKKKLTDPPIPRSRALQEIKKNLSLDFFTDLTGVEILLWIREAQKLTGPTDPDPAPDPEHCSKKNLSLDLTGSI
jgi:hypothetical protein